MSQLHLIPSPFRTLYSAPERSELSVNWMQGNQGNCAVSPGLIACVGRIELQQQGPEPPAIGRRYRAGPHATAGGPNLNERFRVRLEIKPPGRVVQRTAIRRHKDQHVIDRKVEQRRRLQFATSPAPGGEQQHRHAEEGRSKPAAAQAIYERMGFGK